MSQDHKTAEAFASSWNNLPSGSVYTKDQFEDWLSPVVQKDIEGTSVLELGCGNASLMTHIIRWNPQYLEGVDLGSSILSATDNMNRLNLKNWKVTQGDMSSFESGGFGFVYCIGVLHHLKNPKAGFDSVIRNTKKGGRFHCWVYAREGNGFIVYVVDPIRKVVSRLPWWFTKYCVATPLAIPFYFYAKTIALIKNAGFIKKFPLYDYSLWISKREFGFFRHVAFDQLVTPQTTYIRKELLQEWLDSYPNIEKESVYIIFRNGNSWKFGGEIK